jgi:lysophospholipase L1-like esterase
MVRRILTVTAAAVLLAAQALIAPVASAQANTGTATDTASLNPITAGLWAGANFDLSSLGAVNTPPAPQPPETPPTTPPTTGTYAALGDSVAAGIGLPAVSASDDARCGRSGQAYAHQVAQTLQLPLNHIACSGATAGDLVTKQRVSGPNIPAQLDTAYAQGVPSVMSITAGANDVHWVDFLRKCYGATCGTDTDRAIFDAALTLLSAKYFYALSSIQARSGTTPPTLVLTGYYNPFSAACGSAAPQLTPDELAWIDEAVTQLNDTIRETAAGFPFARFAPVDFTGHDACSADSWVQGQNDPAPFHPNARGQQAIAEAVLTSLGR